MHGVGMAYKVDGEAKQRLKGYVDRIGQILRNKRRRASFATYFLGLLGEGERKSIEPIAARAAADPEETRALTERLLHFVGESDWDDLSIRRFATRYAIEVLTKSEPIEAWIVDDTGFIKQGNQSPGVQRQYTGTAGKKTNCQLAPSLTLCTRTTELPVDMDLYLPQSWTDDRARCHAAHIPDSVEFRPKWRITLDLIGRALDAGYPPGLVLGDSAFGDVGEFRAGVRALGLSYAVDVKLHTRVRIVCHDGTETDTMSVETVSRVLGASEYRNLTWRQGTRCELSSRFACIRVKVVTEREPEGGEEQWLVIGQPKQDEPPEHYTLATLPKATTHKELIRRIKQRWRIERTYEDLKGELGLDHFEGRSYRGWQHHVTCVLTCAAFIIAEKARAFSPSSRGTQSDGALDIAA